jgi:hypothetical protein
VTNGKRPVAANSGAGLAPVRMGCQCSGQCACRTRRRGRGCPSAGCRTGLQFRVRIGWPGRTDTPATAVRDRPRARSIRARPGGRVAPRGTGRRPAAGRRRRGRPPGERG